MIGFRPAVAVEVLDLDAVLADARRAVAALPGRAGAPEAARGQDRGLLGRRQLRELDRRFPPVGRIAPALGRGLGVRRPKRRRSSARDPPAPRAPRRPGSARDRPTHRHGRHNEALSSGRRSVAARTNHPPEAAPVAWTEPSPSRMRRQRRFGRLRGDRIPAPVRLVAGAFVDEERFEPAVAVHVEKRDLGIGRLAASVHRVFVRPERKARDAEQLERPARA